MIGLHLAKYVMKKIHVYISTECLNWIAHAFKTFEKAKRWAR